MGRIIAVVGTTGVGKTAMVRALCKHGLFAVGLEQHKERPFQEEFKTNSAFALPNQIDYLLLRAEQEQILRQSTQTGLVDGGLDLDYHGFTQLYYSRGWLSGREYNLCERFYEFVRTFMPPPDLVIHLTARPEVIHQRLVARRRINITDPRDIQKLASYLDGWLSTIPPEGVIRLDVSETDPGYRYLLPSLLPQLHKYIM
jgi:Deoxynucleoside kinases